MDFTKIMASRKKSFPAKTVGDLRALIKDVPDDTKLEMVWAEEVASVVASCNVPEQGFFSHAYDNKEVPVTHMEVNSRGLVLWNDDNVC